jgi:8-oxo-dGTP pyrophosphatase MutT (NUDIX family)
LDLIDSKYSLGFGGHVQYDDFNLFTIDDEDSGYTASLFRELNEEVGIERRNIKDIRTIGMLNDDSSPKGKCHFAFLHLVELANPVFTHKEKWVINPTLVSINQIAEEFESYEYWSKLCLEHFFSDELKNLKFHCFIDNRRGLSLKTLGHLAIVGEIGSGKSEVCSVLEKSLVMFVYRAHKFCAGCCRGNPKLMMTAGNYKMLD